MVIETALATALFPAAINAVTSLYNSYSQQAGSNVIVEIPMIINLIEARRKNIRHKKHEPCGIIKRI